MAVVKYPFEIATVQSNNKVFSVDAKFSHEEESDKPLQVFDNKFSRFVVNLIDNGKIAFLNIPLDELSGIEARTDYAMKKHMEVKIGPGPQGDSPAFTVRFKAGQNKGLTPIEVLLKNPAEGKEILNGEYKWLKENLVKYPANKEIMDAISDAASIDLDGLSIPQSVPPIPLLEIGYRPLVRRKRDDGKCLCYEGNITWNTSNKYPVQVVVKNYYAPVKETESGLLNVSLREKDTSSELAHSFSMTESKWLNVVSCMRRASDNYYSAYFRGSYTKALQADKEIREAANLEKVS